MATLVDNKNNLSVRRATSGPIPAVPFVRIKNIILGKKYEMSILFADPKTATELHKKWKQKSTPANILSFPYDENSGEIVVSLSAARSEHKKYGYSYLDYLIFLIIHGMTHLQGHDHSYEMEKLEKKYREKIKLPEPVYI